MNHEQLASAEAERVVGKLRRVGEGNIYRESELDGLAVQLGYRRRDAQIDGVEWLASMLATAGVMPAATSRLCDPEAPPLRFRSGAVVAKTPGSRYVADAVNGLLGSRVRAG